MSLLSNVQLVLILTISMRDQIETTLPGLNVRPDIGVAARVIMQPVRNQFKLLKFGLGVGARSARWSVSTRWWRKQRKQVDDQRAAQQSLTSSAHL